MVSFGGESSTSRPTFTAALMQEGHVGVHSRGVDDMPSGVPTDFSLKYGVSIDTRVVLMICLVAYLQPSV